MSRPIGAFTLGMTLAVRQAGGLALGLQGRVANDGKQDLTFLPNDDELLLRRRAAKTVVDELVQDLLILAALEQLDGNTTLLDAEEETSMTALFGRGAGKQTLVIDPIDGTLEYLAGESSYSICVGLVENHRMITALVYFPARDTLYLLDQQGQAFAADQANLQGLARAEPLQCKPAANDVIYVNGRVPHNIQERLRARGYQVVDDTVDGRGAPDCILDCLTGRARAYLAHTRQMRDILLGGIIAGVTQGYALDWQGRPLAWPKSGRVDRAIFGCGDIPHMILDCLRE